MAQPLPEAPWGVLIGAYLVLVGVATGITLLALWVHPEDERAQVHYAWRTTWAAFLVLAAASTLLVIDLGRPWRFYLMVVSLGNLSSPMSIGAKLIAAKLFLLAVDLYLLGRRRQALAAGDLTLTGPASRALSTGMPLLLGVLSLALAVYPAVLLARTWSSPLARAAGAGVVFVSTALLMGAAVALILVWTGGKLGDTALRERLGRLLLFLVLGQGPLLGLWLLSVEAHAAPLAQGTGGAIFWLGIVGLGLVLPAFFLSGRAGGRAVAVGCATAALLGAATTRYLFIALP
jgi:formate-dependent nitrite reductase membrane component NrfD